MKGLKDLESVTLNFKKKEFTFYKDDCCKQGHWKLAELKVPKTYWGFRIKIYETSRRKMRYLDLNLFRGLV